jgi:hypothetical protein
MITAHNNNSKDKKIAPPKRGSSDRFSDGTDTRLHDRTQY